MASSLRPASEASLNAVKKLNEYTENPFRCLDDDWIPIVLAFIQAKGKLVESPTKFCMTVAIQQRKGLTLTGLKAVLGRLTDAEVAATHNYDNQLYADFHGLCAHAIRNQRRINEKRAREEAEQNRESAAAVILKLADATKVPVDPLPAASDCQRHPHGRGEVEKAAARKEQRA